MSDRGEDDEGDFEDDESDDGYDWSDLVPGFRNHDGSVAAWIPREMHAALLDLEGRRHTMSHEKFGDEIARVMRFPPLHARSGRGDDTGAARTSSQRRHRFR